MNSFVKVVSWCLLLVCHFDSKSIRYWLFERRLHIYICTLVSNLFTYIYLYGYLLYYLLHLYSYKCRFYDFMKIYRVFFSLIWKYYSPSKILLLFTYFWKPQKNRFYFALTYYYYSSFKIYKISKLSTLSYIIWGVYSFILYERSKISKYIDGNLSTLGKLQSIFMMINFIFIFF